MSLRLLILQIELVMLPFPGFTFIVFFFLNSRFCSSFSRRKPTTSELHLLLWALLYFRTPFCYWWLIMKKGDLTLYRSPNLTRRRVQKRNSALLCFYHQCSFHLAPYVFLFSKSPLLFSHFLSFLFFVFDIDLTKAKNKILVYKFLKHGDERLHTKSKEIKGKIEMWKRNSSLGSQLFSYRQPRKNVSKINLPLLWAIFLFFQRFLPFSCYFSLVIWRPSHTTSKTVFSHSARNW